MKTRKFSWGRRKKDRWTASVTQVAGDELRAKREKALSLMKMRYEMLKARTGGS